MSAGDTIRYTVTGSNTGATPLEVDVTDNLSGVLPWAEFQTGAQAGNVNVTILDPKNVEVPGANPPPATFDREQKRITWTGRLEPGQQVRLVYVVRVKAEVWNQEVTIENKLNSKGTPPTGPDITPPEEKVTHKTRLLETKFTKVSDPPTTTSISPGDTVTYTLSQTNPSTSKIRFNPLRIRDDLTDVLKYADFNQSYNGNTGFTVRILNQDGSEVPNVPMPTFRSPRVDWAGVIEPGQRVDITYQVKAFDDPRPHGKRIVNRARSAASAEWSDRALVPQLDAWPDESEFTPEGSGSSPSEGSGQAPRSDGQPVIADDASPVALVSVSLLQSPEEGASQGTVALGAQRVQGAPKVSRWVYSPVQSTVHDIKAPGEPTGQQPGGPAGGGERGVQEPGSLADTGLDGGLSTFYAAAMLLGLGVTALILVRRRRSS